MSDSDEKWFLTQMTEIEAGLEGPRHLKPELYKDLVQTIHSELMNIQKDVTSDMETFLSTSPELTEQQVFVRQICVMLYEMQEYGRLDVLLLYLVLPKFSLDHLVHCIRTKDKSLLMLLYFGYYVGNGSILNFVRRLSTFSLPLDNFLAQIDLELEWHDLNLLVRNRVNGWWRVFQKRTIPTLQGNLQMVWNPLFRLVYPELRYVLLRHLEHLLQIHVLLHQLDVCWADEIKNKHAEPAYFQSGCGKVAYMIGVLPLNIWLHIVECETLLGSFLFVTLNIWEPKEGCDKYVKQLCLRRFERVQQGKTEEELYVELECITDQLQACCFMKRRYLRKNRDPMKPLTSADFFPEQQEPEPVLLGDTYVFE